MDKAQSFLMKILLGGISVLIAEFLLPGVHIDDFLTGFILAAFLKLINLTLKPLLVILTLPYFDHFRIIFASDQCLNDPFGRSGY